MKNKSRQNGLVVIDKPTGITSFDVVQRVRRMLGEKRVGHTGTLDPLATGVLPICVGEATKLVPFFIEQEKAYLVTAQFGVATTTYDIEGEIVREIDTASLDKQQVSAALPQFTGAIEQKPPIYSAIRVNGKRLYEHARAGEDVEIAARPVEVFSYDLLSWRPGARAEADFSIVCSKGTYVRSLVADLGAALGTGARVTQLRRTRAGRFNLAQAVTLETLAEKPSIMSLDQAAALFPTVSLAPADVQLVRQGQNRGLPAWSGPSGAYVAVLGPDKQLIAIAQAGDVGPAAGSLRLTRVFG